jgi:oligosaccharide repeat unit polymerase
VILVFTLFLLLSLSPVHESLVINLIIAFVFFFIGSLFISELLFRKKNPDKPSFSINVNSNNFLKFNQKDIYSIGFSLFLISIVFFALSIASVGGIPLLKPSLRYSLKPLLTLPIFCIVPAIALIFSTYLSRYDDGELSRKQVRFRFLVLIIISSGFLLLLGYRTPVLAGLLVMIIMAYYGKVLAIWEIILGIIFSVLLIVGIGYFRSLSEYAITVNTSPFYSLQKRADFTLHVLNLLNLISGNFGILHGSLLPSAIPTSDFGPRMIIGQLIAWRTSVTITPTLIGPLLVDFGRVGLAIGMCIFGLILGIGHKLIKLTKDNFYIAIYGILLAYTILGVETGILDINILLYFLVGILIYGANVFRVNRS